MHRPWRSRCILLPTSRLQVSCATVLVCAVGSWRIPPQVLIVRAAGAEWLLCSCSLHDFASGSSMAMQGSVARSTYPSHGTVLYQLSWPRPAPFNHDPFVFCYVCASLLPAGPVGPTGGRRVGAVDDRSEEAEATWLFLESAGDRSIFGHRRRRWRGRY